MKNFAYLLAAGAALSLPLATPAAAASVAEAATVQPVDSLRWSDTESGRRGADRLISFLKTSNFEGFTPGPALAASAEALRARMRAGDAAAGGELDALLDKAFLDYTSHLNAPVEGIIYGDETQRPRNFSRDSMRVRMDHVPDFGAFVAQQLSLNPVYDKMRAEAMARGAVLPDESKVALAATLDRLRGIPSRERFVLVDVASQRLWMYEAGQPVDSMKVIVGTTVGSDDKPSTEFLTPLINSTIHYATFNPYWHVPPHLVKKIVAPGYKKGGKAYLNRQGYELVAEWSNEAQILDPATADWSRPLDLKVRQLPSTFNSMGDYKFNFPNGEGIYLHDTPDTDKFKYDVRTISNGCIRLEDADRFAQWLYKGQPVPVKGEGRERHELLPEGVPVFVTYMTAEAVEGPLTFVADVYGKDAPYEQRLASL